MSTDTNGGAHVSGNAHAGRDFIGRDQINQITNNAVSLFFLDPMNRASDAIRRTLGADTNKQALLDGLEPRYDENKQKLEETNDSIASLSSGG